MEALMLKGNPSDYSDKNNWLACPQVTKNVDTFYIYPTSNVNMAPDAPQICEITDEGMRKMAQGMYEEQATAFEESTNVFAPYYRQTNVQVLMGFDVKIFEEFQKQEQRTDIYAALDYYFENLNQGRPFILASHSQGSCMSKLVLGEYMQLHPEYLERMIAAYPIGFSFTEKWFKEHPGLKFAEGESDTGVIVSWNTEGPENIGQKSLVLEDGAMAINPLNWRRDGVPADKSENPGSRLKNESTGEYQLISGLADATVDQERGSVICNVGKDYYAPGTFFGTASCHFLDYDLYYISLQRNVRRRIRSWMDAHI